MNKDKFSFHLVLINRSILPSVPAPGQHSAHPSDLKEKPSSSLTASCLCGHSAASQGSEGFPREASARDMQGGDTGAPQELLWDPFSSVRTGIIAAGTQEQPKTSSIPEAAAPPAPGASLLPKSQLLGSQRVKEQLQGCSRDLYPVPHLLPPQQTLLDKVDLAAHCKTTLPAQPFPLIQFMPGIKTSLGSPLTAANICRVGRRRAWRRVGKLQSH